jgi:ketosteroid isomerase-like protein
MSQENVEIVRSMFEAYGGRDYPAASDAAHADIEIHPAMTGWLEGTVYRGPDGFRQFLEDVDAAWDEFRIEMHEYRDLGKTVLALGQTWGRGRDGIKVDSPGGWVCDMRQGKIQRFRSFNTWGEALEAVGLSE